MTSRVLIIGGYGNFGGFISRALAGDKRIQLIIAGRSREKANALCAELHALNQPETVALDITGDFKSSLIDVAPHVTIHTSGPFQGQDYAVAEACIAVGSHYVDLADSRRFVCGIEALDQRAREKSVLVVSGASSVPCLSAALVDHYKETFAAVETLDYGITTAQQTARGLATTAAILSYVGRPFKTLIDGSWQDVYGWQDLYSRVYPVLGRRLLGNCDVPDLDIFPARYPTLRTIRFRAGLELPMLHLSLWLLAGLVRIGLIRGLERAAPALLRISNIFDHFGTDNSALHMVLAGIDGNGARRRLSFNLTATHGDGPNIPCIPAIVLARRLTSGKLEKTGATACVDLISLDDYLGALKQLHVTWGETVSSA